MSEMNKIINEIKDNLSQRGSSQKDEVRVMQAMLNDKEYIVDVYGNTGKIGEYSPSEDARKMTASIISSATKISKDEASFLASEHEFTKGEAASMVNISKEFINTYTKTKRKLPLGGRADSNVSLLEDEGKTTVRFPKKSVDSSGNESWKILVKEVPPYSTIKAVGSCPNWLKK